MKYRIMVFELHARPFEIESESPSEAIEKLQKQLEEGNIEMPESVPLQLLSSLLWPVTKASNLIIPDIETKITKIN